LRFVAVFGLAWPLSVFLARGLAAAFRGAFGFASADSPLVTTVPLSAGAAPTGGVRSSVGPSAAAGFAGLAISRGGVSDASLIVM